MNATRQHSTIFGLTLRFIGVLLLLCWLSNSAFAQNTKGDRPASSRESRFKGSGKKDKGKIVRGGPRKKVGGEGYSPRGRARGGERAGRPIRPSFNVHKPSDKQKPWKGDLSGRKLQHKNQSSDKYKPPVYRQTGPNVKRRVPDREGRQNVARGRPAPIPSVTGKVRNVYPQKGPYVSNPHSKPRKEPKATSNRVALSRLKSLQSNKKTEVPGERLTKVKPKSASRPFIRNKSINVWANFKRPKKKGERAQTTDLAGRKIRGRNYETPKPGLLNAPNPYARRPLKGKDRANLSKGYNKSATRGATAWIGDLAGRVIRHKDKSSKKNVEGRPYPGGGINYSSRRSRVSTAPNIKSATRTGKVTTSPVPVKKPGYGAMGLGYKGKRGRDGKRVNTSGIPVRSRGQGAFADQGIGFSGFKKAQRPLKGGGSVSGRRWNNDGRALPPRVPKQRDLVNLPGNFRAKRPLKGGGSVSGRIWNNDGRALPPRVPKQKDLTNLPGNFRARRPDKGGGSVSGQLWNNNETPIQTKVGKNRNVASWQGNMKAKRKGITANDRAAGSYTGFHKLHQIQPAFDDQGEGFSGHKKLSRFRRTYIQNKLAAKESLKKQRPDKGAFEVEGLQTKVQRRSYVRNKDLSEEAMKKLKPTETDESVGGLQVKVQRRAYVRNKNISEEAMKKLKPTDSDRAVAGVYGKVRQYNYVRNPSSSKDALKVREPGKAFARATDYQGNIKMKKYAFFEKDRRLHPDAQFVKTNKNNVKGEKDPMTNLKLWWARLFRKQDTQPEHLKEKLRKPRYDKGEDGLWYD